ncbi:MULTISPECIES: alpha/beta hydrolase [Curtobacterium]|uniref:Alpha/beta hydrolase n=1 Tax=Curtobacterium poinsettiae TaxID=159612 RepID=A0ABT3S5C1_9MICO|nr:MULTISPECIES: alpha/beta hydrolase [Curtobacterium]MBT1610017.1 alpha/beta hydrolase [Curtobacterium flaccumfaciens pv. poinsettiae]MCS6564323.1 alpha/beta hydrolase [Curtobacterium flaccumfaciens pv. flaccumfaciens]MCU0151820.1 alpha/beta hydrolase [Curtobacterium flaccumfaciens pv. poinsettiae]MCX2850017.1 alpha/beta hydrolase [Curtobacterium flaccumfaciens pv. poinsettiae]UXN16182.1 alpha/beta hydrolase [Curtobacterium flaccumfaciens pv. poinsettiae]
MPTFSAARGDASFTDAHGVEIVYSTWRAARPKGVVQIAHGVGEHGLRYEPLAQDLVRAGYTVHANDHRGHGRTGLAQWDGDHAKLGRLGPGGLRAAIAAVEQMSAVARADEPGLPLVLLGHSWGSLMAQRIVNTSSDRYDGVVLSASAYRLPGWMNSGDLNARHAGSGPTKYEWLTRDRKVIDAMAVDPLAVEADVIGLFGLADTLRLLGVPRRGIPHDLPMLLQVGSDDTLGGPRSIERLAQAYRRRGRLSDVTVQVYEGARHEVYNETNRAEVIGDLVAWLDRVTAR